MSDNYELLEWAKYNLKEWKEGYTHLRGDSTVTSTFFTRGKWDLTNNKLTGNWYSASIGTEWFPVHRDIKWSSPQSITKEEWLQATNPTKDGVELTRSDLVAGKHIVVDSEGWVLLVLDGGLAVHLTGHSHIRFLKDYKEDFTTKDSFHHQNIDYVYEINGIDDLMDNDLADSENWSLVWSREDSEKANKIKEKSILVEEAEKALQIAKEELESLKQKLED